MSCHIAAFNALIIVFIRSGVLSRNAGVIGTV